MTSCLAFRLRTEFRPSKTFLTLGRAALVAFLAWNLAPVSTIAIESSKNHRDWLDSANDAHTRAAILLQQMTLTEKIGQMQQVNGIGGKPTGNADNLVAESDLYKRIEEGKLGAILNERNTLTINALQRVAVQKSRLGIPLIFGRDVIHGFRTIFPIPVGQAASWNPELVEQAAAVAAKEARSIGIHWTFAPMMDIARDARWGRIAEGYGEDPYLASILAKATIHGFQGDDISAPDRVAACAKHFAGYGAAEGGRDYNTTVISPSLLHNIYLPPFKAAVEANVSTFMTAFNDVNGVPCSGHKFLLRNVLRMQWGFQGFVVSDWESIEEMVAHGFCKDDKHAALAAATAGLNMEMTSPTYRNHLEELVQEGQISESSIDQLVLEILRLKFRLGLFENPYTDDTKPSVLLAEDHLEVSRQLARQSIVMLKNDHLLPLSKERVKSIAVIGPQADAKRDQLGTWIPDGKDSQSQTPLMAIKELLSEDTNIQYAPGLPKSLEYDEKMISEALDLAQSAEVVLLFIGERASHSGEARSRGILDIPGDQDKLLSALTELETPIVLIVQAGRPLTIGKQIPQAEAILYSLHAGTMAGPAIMDLIFGSDSPSGKLPVTLPKSVGQLPMYYNHVNTGRPPRKYDFNRDLKIDETIRNDLGYNSNYIDVSPYPLYPFGYGLSYTTFEYGKAEIPKKTLKPGQVLRITIPVTNVGNYDADEVVQLYVRDMVGSVTRPVRELKRFRRVSLKKGEQQLIEFSLHADDLAFYNNEQDLILEPGMFEIYVGGSSLAPLVGDFELLP